MVRRILRVRIQTQPTRQLPVWCLSSRKNYFPRWPQQSIGTIVPQNTNNCIPHGHYNISCSFSAPTSFAAGTLLADLVCLFRYQSWKWISAYLGSSVVHFMGTSSFHHHSSLLCFHLACWELFQRRRSSFLGVENSLQCEKRSPEQISNYTRIQKDRCSWSRIGMIEWCYYDTNLLNEIKCPSAKEQLRLGLIFAGLPRNGPEPLTEECFCSCLCRMVASSRLMNCLSRWSRCRREEFPHTLRHALSLWSHLWRKSSLEEWDFWFWCSYLMVSRKMT